MNISDEDRRRVFNRSNGMCEYCHNPLVYKNHGVYNCRGGWHLDHRKPRAEGGTDDISNLVAACIDCNLSKGDGSARSFRYQMKPLRIKRRNEAIVRDIRAASPGLGLLLLLGAIDIRDWWRKRRERERGQLRGDAAAIQDAEQSFDVPWLGLFCLVFLIVVVTIIVKSHNA
jgi:hypothetical protein